MDFKVVSCLLLRQWLIFQALYATFEPRLTQTKLSMLQNVYFFLLSSICYFLFKFAKILPQQANYSTFVDTVCVITLTLNNLDQP